MFLMNDDWEWIGEWLAAVRTENESESLCEARLVADLERVIVVRDNESESLLESR